MKERYMTRKVWESKPQLRRVYKKWYALTTKFLKKGKTLEVGCGIGNFKEHYKCIGIDIDHTSEEDVLTSATALPFKSERFDNVICFDVVHHISNYPDFFAEAVRVLNPGGRFVIFEPHLSSFSRIVRRLFHHEDIKTYPRYPRVRDALLDKNFKLIYSDFYEFFAYPASGGFSGKTHIGEKTISFLQKVDDTVYKIKPLKAMLAFKFLIVVEKNRYDT